MPHNELIDWRSPEGEALRSQALNIDLLLLQLTDFWDRLESRCTAECCGIAAFELDLPTIRRAAEGIGRATVEARLRAIIARVEASPSTLFVSDRLNAYLTRPELLRLLHRLLITLNTDLNYHASPAGANALRLGNKGWVHEIDVQDRLSEAIPIDPHLRALEPFWSQLQPSAAAGTAVLNNLDFDEDTVRQAAASAGKLATLVHLTSLQDHVLQLPGDILLSQRLNWLGHRAVLLKILEYLMEVIHDRRGAGAI